MFVGFLLLFGCSVFVGIVVLVWLRVGVRSSRRIRLLLGCSGSMLGSNSMCCSMVGGSCMRRFVGV